MNCHHNLEEYAVKFEEYAVKFEEYAVKLEKNILAFKTSRWSGLNVEKYVNFHLFRMFNH